MVQLQDQNSDNMVKLKEHLESRCDERTKHHVTLVHQCEFRVSELEKQISARFQWLEQTTRDTKEAMEDRLKGMNEFRDTLRDQSAQFFTRKEHEGYRDSVTAQMATLQDFRAEMRGKATQHSTNVALFLAVIGSVLGVASFVVSLMRALKG